MSLVLTPIPEGSEFPPFIIKFQSGHSTSLGNLGRKSVGMWCLVSPTHKKWLFVCQTRMKFGTIYVSKRQGYLCDFADGWKANINPEQWTLCQETSLCTEYEVKALFLWSSLKLCLFSLCPGDKLIPIFSGPALCVKLFFLLSFYFVLENSPLTMLY